MRIPRSTSAGLALVLTVALAIRVAAALAWDARLDGRFQFGDSESYWALAGQIYRGEPYQFGGPDARVFRTPGYPALLAGLFAVWGRADPPVLAARLLGAALGTLTTAGVFVLGWQVAGRATGLVAALLVAFYPGAIGLSVFVLSEAPFCAVMVAQLCATLAAGRATTLGHAIGWALAVGVLAGVATLIRPSWFLFTPAVAVGRLVVVRRRSEAAACLATVAALAAVMSPWWIRNAEVTGHFVPTTLQVGASLYDGLNPAATGASDMRPVDAVARLERLRPAPPGAANLEYRIDLRLKLEALAWAQAHPRQVLKLAVAKFARLWNVWPNEPEFRSWPLRLLTLASYVPLMALAIWATCRQAPQRTCPAIGRWAIVVCWLPAAYFTALHVVFVSSLRYREPAMIALAVLAAAALVVPRAAAPCCAPATGGA